MFEGFSAQTVDFLWGIRFNNNREWFLEHKKEYVEHLYEPMKALGKELFTLFENRTGDLLKVSRIYRDARMHHDLPYKESLWICIRKDVAWWGENPCLYFEIRPEGISYGFFLWQPRTATRKDWYADWTANPKKFLKLIRDTEKKTGLKITAQTYKRPPQTAPTKELEPYFAWRGCIDCTVTEEFSDSTFDPGLKDRVLDLFQKLLPLYDYFNQFKV